MANQRVITHGQPKGDDPWSTGVMTHGHGQPNNDSWSQWGDDPWSQYIYSANLNLLPTQPQPFISIEGYTQGYGQG